MRGTRPLQARKKRFGDSPLQLDLPIPDLVNAQDPTVRLCESPEIDPSPFVDKEKSSPALIAESKRNDKTDMECEEKEGFARRARKMEAMGTLASGIAHDFNNILTPILLRTEMAMAQLQGDNPLRYQLEQVLTCGQRARDLVQQILNFSHQNDRGRKPLQISLVVKEVLKLLRSSLPSTIEIRQDITGSGMVLADLSMIQLLLTELCVGTAQQMDDKGGVLEVSLCDVELDEEGTVPLLSLPKGSYVKLSVKQEVNGVVLMRNREGAGGEEETDPPIVMIRHIVEQHGGRIAVYREAERSMTRHIFLPRMESRFPSNGAEPSPLPRGTERILLVDDEKEVMETFRQMLTYLGYSVFSATSGLVALEVFRKAPDGFDLLITDQTMPKMTGVQLASEVKRIRPDLPVLLCSGFGDVIQSEEARKVGLQEVVMKPLTATEIAQKIRQVLERDKR